MKLPKFLTVLRHIWRALSNKPVYTHDCDGCLFMGRYRSYDLYCCPPSSTERAASLGPTLLARYADEGSKYTSTDARLIESWVSDGIMDCTVTPNVHLPPSHPYISEHPLVKARQRAIDRQLYTVLPRDC